MAKLPQPQDLAREILAVLLDDGCRPGTGMPLPALRQKFGITRPGEDLKAGMLYAHEQGWLDLGNDGMFVKFTEAGFAAA